MNLQKLQIKNCYLRLNLEQIQHMIDGLHENRKNIVSEDLLLYDAQVTDVISQLNAQGIHIEIDEPEAKETEYEQVKEITLKVWNLLNKANMDTFERIEIQDELYKLNKLLFG